MGRFLIFLTGLIVGLIMVHPAGATWKPEYAKNPQAVQDWFRAQMLTPEAQKHFVFTSCCDDAERLMTKFVGSPGHEWSYYPDPACDHAGCKLLPIPHYAEHIEGISALNPKDDNLPEFEAMRAEGILMIYAGEVTCFWMPEGSI